MDDFQTTEKQNQKEVKNRIEINFDFFFYVIKYCIVY